MGTEVEPRVFSRADRAAYRQKVRTSLDVFAQMLSEARFDFERPMTGLEIELNLVDERAEPAMRNAEVLAAIAGPSFQTELGQFNIEINVAPRRLAGSMTPSGWSTASKLPAHRRARSTGRSSMTAAGIRASRPPTGASW